jgi:hypothetical protein
MMNKLDWLVDVTQTDDALEFDTLDEAIAAALADLGPGGIVTIHEEHCAIDSDDETACDCDALEIRKGAEA